MAFCGFAGIGGLSSCQYEEGASQPGPKLKYYHKGMGIKDKKKVIWTTDKSLKAGARRSPVCWTESINLRGLAELEGIFKTGSWHAVWLCSQFLLWALQPQLSLRTPQLVTTDHEEDLQTTTRAIRPPRPLPLATDCLAKCHICTGWARRETRRPFIRKVMWLFPWRAPSPHLFFMFRAEACQHRRVRRWHTA